ncbi:MAG: DUF1576 domain-containing protein [Defluviitaleaceae bacterium]|nr:DUF1576 domain-containing protein [Defluviitaleaceae bacterium]
MQKLKSWLMNPYVVLYIIFIYFIVFALIVDTPYEIFNGLIAIALSYDLLITDYVAVGGVGATLVNSAIVNLIFLTYMARIQRKASGSLIMAFWLLAGFSFFGKNFINVWPILIGGYLYSKFRKESFERYAVVSALATALGPIVTQIAYLDHIPIVPRLIFAVVFGIFIGFIVPPISQNLMNVHQGFNLYNVGFTAGILAILTRIFVSVIGGGEVNPIFIYWSTEYLVVLCIFMGIIFAFLFFVGWICGESHKENLQGMFKRTGQAASDYYADYGEVTYINMGLLGLSVTILMLAIGSDINGPVVGSIFTVVGFGAFGKHMRNIWPVIAGCLLAGGFVHIFFGSNPSSSIAVLLVSCLAPIAGRYGWKWGVVAGFVHLNIAMHVVNFSGGFNLYNNGLAAGFVTMFLLPIIRVFND